MIELYKLDSKGRIRVWKCWAVLDDNPGICYTDGLQDGKLKDPTFKASKRMNVGRANELSEVEQAKAMLEQEIGKKLKDNYSHTPEGARANKEFRPMLCPAGMKWHEWARKVAYPAYVSPKLDGARCNAMLVNGEVLLFTRTGKQWMACQHVSNALKPFFEKHPNVILDGEFYNHRYRDNFEDLMSILKKQKPSVEDILMSQQNIQYHVYDAFFKSEVDLIFSTRKQILEHDLKDGIVDGFIIKRIDHKAVYTEQEFDELHETAIKLGYEGTILRLDCPYQPEVRSKYLLKRKDIYDLEATILKLIEGEGNNAGMCASMLIRLPDGVEQEAGLGKGLNHEKATEMLNNPQQYEGKTATFHYFGYTNSGKLRFPKYMRLRESIDV